MGRWSASPGLLCSRLSSVCLSCRRTTASRTTSTSSTSRTRPGIRRRSHSWRSQGRRSTTPSEKLWVTPRSCWPSRSTSSPQPVQDGYVSQTQPSVCQSRHTDSPSGSFHAEHQSKRRRPAVPPGLLPGRQRAASLTATRWCRGKTEKRRRNQLSSSLRPPSVHPTLGLETGFFFLMGLPESVWIDLILRDFNGTTER